MPRADGVVVGATQYEHGRDTAPAVTGVRELLDDACAVIPALGEYELAECAAGLRPMTPPPTTASVPAGEPANGSCNISSSLRRHDPDQVRR